MPWIERFGDLAAEIGQPCMRGQQTGLQANDEEEVKMFITTVFLPKCINT